MFTLTVVAETAEEGHGYIEMAIREIERIEALLSTYNDNSQTQQIKNTQVLHP